MYRCIEIPTHRDQPEFFLQQWNPESSAWEFVEGTNAVSLDAPTFRSMFGLEPFGVTSLPGAGDRGWCSKDPVAVYRTINWLNGGTGEIPSFGLGGANA